MNHEDSYPRRCGLSPHGSGYPTVFMPKQPVRALRILYAGYCLVVCGLVFTPTPEVASTSVHRAHSLAGTLGAPDWLSPSVVEFVANIALFVPMSLLGSRLRPGWGWLQWTLVGLLASTTIELVQLTLLPARSATVPDVVANTVGAGVGVALARAVTAFRRVSG